MGAATGLAGLLFVAFSIYVANWRIDILVQRLGALYFAEILTSLTIGLSAILPPHVRWAGAILGATNELVWWILALQVAMRYRKAFQSRRERKISTGEQDERLRMFESNLNQVNTLFVPLCESLLAFAGGVAGSLAYFDALPAFIPA